MTFWIPVAIGTVLVLIWMVLPLLRGRTGQGKTRATYDMQVFKDQLTEIDSDLTRGVLDEAEATRSRTEISRRLLAAANAEGGETGAVGAPRSANLVLMALIVLAIGAGGFGVYRSIGQPGMQDLPLTANLARQNQRLSQDEAEIMVAEQEAAGSLQRPDLSPRMAETLALIESLREALESRPDELEGHRLLVVELGRIGEMAEARKAQDQVMRILGNAATGQDYTDSAELMIIAANGYVSPAAVNALDSAYQLTPSYPPLLFYIGHTLMQEGDYRRAYNIWVGLLESSPPDAPWIAPIQAQIGALAEAAGIDPSQLRGPDAQDIEDASQLSPEEQSDMIRTMVAGLEERLLADGGSLEEWVRLIGAYGVLNEPDKAAEILAAGRTAFANEPDKVARLNRAAAEAGLDIE